MDDNENAPVPVNCSIIETLDRQFARLHSRSRSLIEATPVELLYTPVATQDMNWPSVGESILRSAAAIERTFGGITANLWDDPFEWTLPEQLATPKKVLGHLEEVEALRARAFSSFTADACLRLSVVTPSGTHPLIQLLLGALVQATDFQSQAMLAQKSLSGITTPGFII